MYLFFMQQKDSAQTSIPFSRGGQWVISTLDIKFYMTNIPAFLLFLSNNEKRDELEHDLQAEIPKLEDWKSHIIRSVHQDAAKTAAVDALSETEALLIMDWAMKFLPTSYRETQRDWFGKKGKPWHITVAITKADNEEIVVRLMLKSCLSYYLSSLKDSKPVTIDIFQTNCNNLQVKEKISDEKLLIIPCG